MFTASEKSFFRENATWFVDGMTAGLDETDEEEEVEEDEGEEDDGEEDEEVDEDDEDVYTVDCILKAKGAGKNRKYFVKWEGYAESEATW
jgi:hypothetical protein